MQYKNLNGTTPNRCKCGSWLAHFQHYGTGTSTKCAVKGCSNLSEVGGHVKKISAIDSKWYIVPLCKACNKLTEGFYLKAVIKKPASANVAMTCGKN